MLSLGLGAVVPVERIRGGTLQRRNAKLRKAAPICVHCLREGTASPVAEWDHITPLSEGGADDVTNLQGLCRRHHDQKSAAEAKRRAAP